jgi:hypothetical protein
VAEFHRRLIALRVRDVTDKLPSNVLRHVKDLFPDLLRDVMPHGRSVEWSEVDQAVDPVLEWKSDYENDEDEDESDEEEDDGEDECVCAPRV